MLISTQVPFTSYSNYTENEIESIEMSYNNDTGVVCFTFKTVHSITQGITYDGFRRSNLSIIFYDKYETDVTMNSYRYEEVWTIELEYVVPEDCVVSISKENSKMFKVYIIPEPLIS